MRKERGTPESTSHPGRDACEPLQAASKASPARVRGARGHAPTRARVERGARPAALASASASARAPERGSVGWEGSEAAAAAAAAEPGSRGDARASRRGSGQLRRGTPSSRPEVGERGLWTAGPRGRRPRPLPGVAAAPGDSP